jgi:hypothetical protein
VISRGVIARGSFAQVYPSRIGGIENAGGLEAFARLVVPLLEEELETSLSFFFRCTESGRLDLCKVGHL